jgi:hypothetical protein
LTDRKRESCLSCSWSTGQKNGAAGHFLCADKIYDETGGLSYISTRRLSCRTREMDLSSSSLPHEASSIFVSPAVATQAKAFDVRMSRGAIFPRVALHFADLNGSHDDWR